LAPTGIVKLFQISITRDEPGLLRQCYRRLQDPNRDSARLASDISDQSALRSVLFHIVGPMDATILMRVKALKSRRAPCLGLGK